VEAVLPEGPLRNGAGAVAHLAPYFEARQGPERNRVHLNWPVPVSGRVVLRVRIDDAP
jgi:hypothetical protein